MSLHVTRGVKYLIHRNLSPGVDQFNITQKLLKVYMFFLHIMLTDYFCINGQKLRLNLPFIKEL